MIKRLALSAAIGALVLSLAPVALAGKGGKPGGGGSTGGGSTTSATIVPSCNPCAAGTTIHFSGSGYNASQGVAKLDMNGGWTATAVNADGTVSFDWPYFTQPATYSVKVYQYGSGGKLSLKAQTSVTVQ